MSLEHYNNNHKRFGYLKYKQNIDNNKDNFKYDLLKIFISLFYYEKSLLLDKKEHIFNENNNYYLINSIWLKEYKKYYNSSHLYELLKQNDKNYNKLYYHNLDNKIDDIINSYIDKNDLNWNVNWLSQELSNLDIIEAQVQNNNEFYIYQNCYIINSKIMDMIKKFFFKNDKKSKNNKIFLEPKQLYYNNKNIYIFDNNNIIIGNTNINLNFITNYIFSYNSFEILNKEGNLLLTNNIEEYIRYRKCVNQKNTKQKLRFKNNEEIGLLVILKNENEQKNYNSVDSKHVTPKDKEIINNESKQGGPKRFNRTCTDTIIKKGNKKSINNSNVPYNNRQSKSIGNSTQNDSLNRSGSTSSFNDNHKNNKSINNKKNVKNNFYNLKTDSLINNIYGDENNKNSFYLQIPLEKNDNKKDSRIKSNLQWENKSNLNYINEINLKEKEIQKQKTLIDQLVNKIKLYENDINNLKINNQNIQNELNITKQDLEKYINLNNNYLKQINYLENNIKEKENELKQYIIDMEKQKDEINKKYKIILAQKKEDKKNLKQNNLAKSVEIEKKEKDKIEKQITFNDENKKLNENCSYLKKINEQFFNEIAKLKGVIAEKEKEIEILKKNNKNEEYLKTIELLNKENNELKLNNSIILKKLNQQKNNTKKQLLISNKINLNLISNNNNKELIQNYLKIIKKLEQNNENLQTKLDKYKEIGYTARKMELTNKEEDLRKRNLEMMKKEDLFNKKMNYLEDKEYQIDKENDELNKKNIKINEMITYNKNLEKELNEIKMKYNQLLSKFENNKNNKNNNNIIKNDISIESSLDADAFIELLNKNKNDTIKNKYKINNQKNEENKQNEKKKGFIELNYFQPTLIGLDNIGATCFMNSTLQCLSQTEGLSNYFLNPKNKNRIINNNIAMVNINDHQLSPFFLELIENLWNKQNSKKSFSPYNIINKINEMNSLFKK